MRRTDLTNCRNIDHFSRYGPLLGLDPEAWFIASFSNDLDIDFAQLDKRAEDCLIHRIARSPNDLSAHVMRIQLCLRFKDPARLYGALLDLNIVLGRNGDRLKHRMLQLAKPVLSDKQLDFLFQNISESELLAETATESDYSVLSKGYTGQARFIEMRKAEPLVLLRTVVQQANDYLEYGQVQEAKQLLEQYIMREPWYRDLHENLLDIYWATRDLKACQDMYGRLSDKELPDQTIWRDMIKRLKNVENENCSLEGMVK